MSKRAFSPLKTAIEEKEGKKKAFCCRGLGGDRTRRLLLLNVRRKRKSTAIQQEEGKEGGLSIGGHWNAGKRGALASDHGRGGAGFTP